MKRLLAIFFAFALMAMGSATAQPSDDTNARLKALYIYNFSKNVNWPTEYKSGNFVIGVMGNDNVYDKLISLYSSKSIGSQPIEIRKCLKVSDIGKCHLLFVPRESNDILPDIVKATSKGSTLLVTESDEAVDQGAIINFIVVDSKLAFEINMKTAAKRSLSIGKVLIDLSK